MHLERLARGRRARRASSSARWPSCARRSGSGSPRAAQAKLKVRQPLRAAVVVAAGAERAAIERLADVVLDELNVKELRYVSQADELGSYEVKPNYRALGPRFGKHDAAGRRRRRRARPGPRGERAARRRPRRHHRRRPRPRARARRPACSRCARSRATSSSARARTRWRSSSSSTTSCAARASRARSCTRSRTRARRRGCEVEDRIELALGGDDELLAAAREHEAYIAGETLALSVAYDADAGEAATIEGRPLLIAVRRA